MVCPTPLFRGGPTCTLTSDLRTRGTRNNGNAIYLYVVSLLFRMFLLPYLTHNGHRSIISSFSLTTSLSLSLTYLLPHSLCMFLFHQFLSLTGNPIRLLCYDPDGDFTGKWSPTCCIYV